MRGKGGGDRKEARGGEMKKLWEGAWKEEGLITQTRLPKREGDQPEMGGGHKVFIDFPPHPYPFASSFPYSYRMEYASLVF